MTAQHFAELFICKLIDHITEEAGDLQYIDIYAWESRVEKRLDEIADFIWEKFKEDE